MTDTSPEETIRQTAETSYSRTRNNQDLSGDAKRRAIATAYLTAQDALDQRQAAAESATTGRLEKLAKQIYGIPSPADASTILGYRDACDRASKFEDESTVIAALNSAAVAGDDLMVRALLALAYAQQWTGPIDAWTARNPGASENAQELWDLTTAPTTNSFIRYLEYHAAVPAELVGLDGYKIREIAAGQPATSQLFS
jgi:hypothetical protein